MYEVTVIPVQGIGCAYTLQTEVIDERGSFFCQAEDGIRDADVTGVQTCASPILNNKRVKIVSRDRLNNPHDKYFRESFSRKETVRSFIRQYLPSGVCRQLDLNKLEIVKDSFVDKELSEHFSDILYKTVISGKQSYLYLLFEHKSYIDHFTGFQLLRNMVKI